MRKTYGTPDIHCKSCAALIQETLEDVPDLSGVSVDLAGKTVTVDYGAAGEREPDVLRLLAEIGYPASPAP